jgi:hypothetical protein
VVELPGVDLAVEDGEERAGADGEELLQLPALWMLEARSE